MAAIGFEYYGQTVATAAPPPARTQPSLVQPTVVAQPQVAGHASDRLFSASLYLLAFAGTLIVAGQLLTLTPLGNVMADDRSGLGVGILIAGLVAAMMVTFFVMVFAKRVKGG